MSSLDSEQVFLKWNNFENNMASGFMEFLQQEAMVDVTLAVEGKLIQAHKIVLSVCSPYFRNMFQMNPCQHPIVILKDVGFHELTVMLDFMYRGEANVKQQDLTSFLKLAETLKVKGLTGDSNSESTPIDNSYLADQDIARESFMEASKNCNILVSNIDEGKRAYNIRKDAPMSSRKRRCGSPGKAVDFKTNHRNEKFDSGETSSDKVDGKYPCIDLDCINIKEERLSDASLDGLGEDLEENALRCNKMLPGPSNMDNLSSKIRPNEEIESELPVYRLMPGPSKPDESSQIIPQGPGPMDTEPRGRRELPEHSRRALRIAGARPRSRLGGGRRRKINISYNKKSSLIRCYEDGKSITESAKIVGINASTARGIINKYKNNDFGEIAVVKQRRMKKNMKLSSGVLDEIENLVGSNPSMTLKQIREKILECKNVDLSLATVQNGLKRLSITFNREKGSRASGSRASQSGPFRGTQ